MIAQFFVTNFAHRPDLHQDHSQLFEARHGLVTFMPDSQIGLARWVEARPRELIRKWESRYAGTGEIGL